MEETAISLIGGYGTLIRYAVDGRFDKEAIIRILNGKLAINLDKINLINKKIQPENKKSNGRTSIWGKKPKQRKKPSDDEKKFLESQIALLNDLNSSIAKKINLL